MNNKEIFLNKNQWKNFSEEELETYKKNVFNYYRQKGFPYFPNSYEWRQKEFNSFMSFNDSNIIDENKNIRQTMHGLAFCWSYMPHAYNVSCNGLKTPLEAFLNDTMLKGVINKRIKYCDNINDNGIRKMLKIYSGVQGVSNFRPTAASALYKKFAENKIVYDMSGGYGGRLLGAIKANVKKYIAVEPCKETYNGLKQISNDYVTFIDNLFFNPIEIELNNCGSESYIPKQNSIDFCFTSPPYFNTEKYSSEETQSYIKFKEKESWLNDFLGTTLDNCYYGLKENGILAVNIANVKTYKNLEEDFLKLAVRKKFILIDILKYNLSSLSHKDKFKNEPVFIFKK